MLNRSIYRVAPQDSHSPHRPTGVLRRHVLPVLRQVILPYNCQNPTSESGLAPHQDQRFRQALRLRLHCGPISIHDKVSDLDDGS